MRNLILLTCVWLLFPSIVFSGLYKCKDSNGKMYFADDPSRLPDGCKEEKVTIVNYGAPKEVATNNHPKKENEYRNMIVGKWKKNGFHNGEPYTIVWEINSDGSFTGGALGVVGSGAFLWKYKGNWNMVEDNLNLEYTWSSTPQPAPGTKEIDKIIEINSYSLTLKSGKDGSYHKYTK